MSEDLSRWYRGRMVVGPFRPFDSREADALERETGRALPAQYRAFLKATGGQLFEYAIRLPDCEPEPLQSFSDLFQLGRDRSGGYGYGTLLGKYRRNGDWWLAGEVSLDGLLPIARNGGNDTLFLDLNPDPATYGRLHAFVHGLPEWTGGLSRGVFTEVAADFDAYLDGLVVDRETAEMAWEDVAGADAADPWRRTVEEWLDRELQGWRAEPWFTGDAATGPR